MMRTDAPRGHGRGASDGRQLGILLPATDCVGLFNDVACPGGFAVKWVEDLANRGIPTGCAEGYYCPANDVSRAEMAVFVGKTFQIPSLMQTGKGAGMMIMDESILKLLKEEEISLADAMANANNPKFFQNFTGKTPATGLEPELYN